MAVYIRKISAALIACLVVVFVLGCAGEEQPDDHIPPLLSETSLPDVQLGPKGIGFTCTGLAYDEKEDVFWVGNCGKTLPGDQAFYATIVKVTKDWTENLGEIKLFEVFASMADVQGVTFDSSDDTLWFCSPAEDKIRHITKDGKHINSFDVKKPTGIAYDQNNDTLWILTSAALMNVDKSGSLITSTEMHIKGQDQLYLDAARRMMYVSAGVNYQGENYIYRVDLTTNEVRLAFLLKDSYAVEGLYMEDGMLYVLNDGYYHSTGLFF